MNRPYQAAAYRRIRSLWERKVRSVLAVAPTGGQERMMGVSVEGNESVLSLFQPWQDPVK